MTERGQSTAATRRTKILEIVADFVDRTSRGEVLDSDALLRHHADLMPDLGDELARQRLIAQARREFEAVSNPLLPSTHGAGFASVDTATLVVRCPHCAHSIEIMADLPWSDITCVGCGNVFSLVSEHFNTLNAPTLKQIAHFELIERIGVGGFGTVWKARDTILDRPVALKLPRRGQLTEEETDKFLREARAAAQLRHPNIVSVHEVGRTEDTVYIVSDLVRGVSLGDWAAIRNPSIRDIAALCHRIAKALAHAHEMGIVHRDLKPGNIMVDADAEPHIMDFGLAKREAGEVTMTVEGQLLGTPAYMAPEQALGQAHKCSPRTDVYSLGVVLFELLTGSLPFRGNTSMLIHQVVHEDPPHPRSLNNHIPVDLETICLRCLEKDPARRFASAGELAAELQRYLQGEPIVSRPVGPITRVARWVRRHTTVAGLGAAFLLTLVLGTAATTYFALRASGFQREKEVLAQRSEGFERQAAEAETEIREKEQRIKQAQRGLSVDASSIFAEGSSFMRGTYNRQLQAATRVGPDRPDQVLALLEDDSRCPIRFHDYVWRRLHRLNSWDTQTLWPRLTEPCVCLAFSSDGRQLSLLGGDQLVRYELDPSGRWKELAAITIARPAAAAVFRPHDLALLTCQFADGMSRFTLHDPTTGDAQPWLNDIMLPLQVTDMAFSPDGRWLACVGPAVEPSTGSPHRSTRIILDTTQNRIAASADWEGTVTDLAWLSSDDSLPAQCETVVSLASGHVEVWRGGGEVATQGETVLERQQWQEFGAAQHVAVAGGVRVVAEEEFLWWQNSRVQRQWLRVKLPRGGLDELAASAERVAAFGRSGELVVREITREPATFKYQVPEGSQFEFSADGKLIAVVAGSQIRLLNLATHGEQPPIALDRPVVDLAWAPTAPRLAYCLDDGTVHMIDLSGSLAVELPFAGQCTCLAFKTEHLLEMGDATGRVVAYDVNSNAVTPLAQLEQPIRDIEHNEVMNLVAVAAGPLIRLMRPDGRTSDLLGHRADVRHLCFSRSGDGSVLSCDVDGEVIRWRPNWTTGKASRVVLATRATESSCSEVAADDQTLMTIQGQRLAFWDGKTGEYRGSLTADDRIVAARFSTWPAGVVVRVALLLASGTLEIWDGAESPSPRTVFPGGVVRDLAWLEGSPYLLAVGDLPQITAIDARDPSDRLVLPTETSVASLAVGGGSTHPPHLAVIRDLAPATAGTRELTLMTLAPETLDPLVTIPLPEGMARADFRQVRLDRQGETLVALARNGTLLTCRVQDSPELVSVPESVQGEVTNCECFALSPAGDQLVAGTRGGQLRLWQRTELTWTLQRETAPAKSTILSVCRLPDGRWASLAANGQCAIWDATLQAVAGEQSMPHAFLIVAHPLKPQIAVATGSAVQLWQVEANHLKREGTALTEHTGVITGMSYSADGQTLATAAEDRTVRFWAAEGGRANSRTLPIPLPGRP